MTREVTAHLHLRHKYIVPLLAAYTEDGRFFMIFENGGVTLQSLWQPRFGCKMREPMRGMMRNLLTGLAYIHEVSSLSLCGLQLARLRGRIVGRGCCCGQGGSAALVDRVSDEQPHAARAAGLAPGSHAAHHAKARLAHPSAPPRFPPSPPQNGYVHGDVKLLNTVILDGVCRLIDMGSAHEIGTPAPEATAIYFAPEVATEVVAAVANGCTDYDEVMARAAHLMQPAIDNYAAGLACVNMLMGEIHYSRGRQPPAPGAAPLPVPAYLEEEVRAARVIVANPYPWHKHPKWHEVDPDLRDVIDALCNPDPKLRATAAEALRMPFLREGAELHEAEAAQPCASPAAPATPGATDAPAAPAASCGGGGGSGASECGGCDAVVIIHAAPQLLKAPAADACAASGVATPAPAETTPVEPSFASATGSRLNADIGTTTSGGSSSSGSSLPAAAGPAAPQSAKRRPLIARALHRCHKRASEAKERVSCAVDAAASSAWACMRPKVAC